SAVGMRRTDDDTLDPRHRLDRAAALAGQLGLHLVRPALVLQPEDRARHVRPSKALLPSGLNDRPRPFDRVHKLGAGFVVVQALSARQSQCQHQAIDRGTLVVRLASSKVRLRTLLELLGRLDGERTGHYPTTSKIGSASGRDSN